jgi:hypothetical protein
MRERERERAQVRVVQDLYGPRMVSLSLLEDGTDDTARRAVI